jgi:hypothetical protein
MIGSNDKKSGGQSVEQRPKDTGKEVTRPGLPAKSSILSERMFVSPGKRRYRIIRTSERDPYDEPETADEKKGR